MTDVAKAISKALWQIYQRPERPAPWVHGGNLPWDDPAFSERMLRKHLDESHGAASRQTPERLMQVDWLWRRLGLQPGVRVLDVTCGPGLYAVEVADRGCTVTGIDFGPAAVAHARQLAQNRGVASRCTFIEQDVRQMEVDIASFDASILLYGQLGVFTVDEAQSLLKKIARALRPGGKLCVELLAQDKIDRKESNWWYTDETGLWGDAPFLHLGERFWLKDEAMSIERFQVIHLESGELTEITLCDQSYSAEIMTEMMMVAGFSSVEVFPAWEGLPLYDAKEWIVFLAKVGD
jgi:SAM-dependent methyltransferase